MTDFVFSGVAYTRPASDAANFAFGGVTGNGAITVDFAVAGSVAHGVAGTGAITVECAVAGVAEFTSVVVEGDGAITVECAVAGSAAHGVAGAGAVTVPFTAAGSAAHGVAGAGAVTVPITAAGSAIHERYELRGEVRQAGVLVNRRVRAYRRDDGSLVGEGDTVAGRFAIHTGFAAREHYVVPVHLDAGATDWVPPVANRVVSVLAQDA